MASVLILFIAVPSLYRYQFLSPEKSCPRYISFERSWCENCLDRSTQATGGICPQGSRDNRLTDMCIEVAAGKTKWSTNVSMPSFHTWPGNKFRQIRQIRLQKPQAVCTACQKADLLFSLSLWEMTSVDSESERRKFIQVSSKFFHLLVFQIYSHHLLTILCR